MRRALRDLMRRGFTSEDGQRSVKGMRDFLREADEKRRELLNKYSPDSFKLTAEEQQALSDKLNSLAEKLEAYHEQMRNFMERMSGKFADRMDELNEKMREAYQRYQELRNRLQNQIAERGMQGKQNMSSQDPQSLMDMLDRMQKLLEDENFLKNLPSMMDSGGQQSREHAGESRLHDPGTVAATERHDESDAATGTVDEPVSAFRAPSAWAWAKPVRS